MATILVVGDRSRNRRFLGTVLGHAGHRVLQREDGAEAIALMRAEPPALVIADIRIPTMNGYEFVRRVRLDPLISQIAIIFFTATNHEAVARALAQKFEVFHLLTGTTEPEVILRIVDEALKQASCTERGESPRVFEIEPISGDEVLPENRTKLQQEIAERSRAEEALRMSEERIHWLLENSSDTITVFAADGTIRYISPSVKRLLGLDPSERIGKNAFQHPLVHRDDVANKQALFEAALRNPGVDQVAQFRLRHADGSWRYIEAIGRNLLDDALVSGIIANYRDITERKRFEEELRASKEIAEAANRAKDRFLAVLSHELRTPLTPVLLTVSALLDNSSQSEDIRPTLEMIRDNIELEARLIDDLLDLTRIAHGKMHLARERVDVHESIRQTLEICRNDMAAGRFRLVLELQATERYVNADRARLHQVFWNLLRNAMKFSPAGGTITIHSRNLPKLEGDSSAPILAVEIADNGIGIEPELLPTIFQAFEQGEVMRARRFGGLGLGLSISKSIVDAHEGRLSARSAGKDQGSLFVLEMATEPAPPPEPCEPARAVRVERRPSALKILLVEDDNATLRVLSRLLRKPPYRLKTANCLSSALELALEEDFDLIISDIGLPDGSGIDLMRQVQARCPTKAIALSGFGMEEDRRNSELAGFVAHLTKPIDFQKLEDTIQRVTTNSALSVSHRGSA